MNLHHDEPSCGVYRGTLRLGSLYACRYSVPGGVPSFRACWAWYPAGGGGAFREFEADGIEGAMLVVSGWVKP